MPLWEPWHICSVHRVAGFRLSSPPRSAVVRQPTQPRTPALRRRAPARALTRTYDTYTDEAVVAGTVPDSWNWELPDLLANDPPPVHQAWAKVTPHTTGVLRQRFSHLADSNEPVTSLGSSSSRPSSPPSVRGRNSCRVVEIIHSDVNRDGVRLTFRVDGSDRFSHTRQISSTMTIGDLMLLIAEDFPEAELHWPEAGVELSPLLNRADTAAAIVSR